MDIYTCYFNMDTGGVDVWLRDGRIISINCTKAEEAYAENMYQRSELDLLIYNDPTAYAELIIEGDPKEYWEAVTQYGAPEATKYENKEFLWSARLGDEWAKYCKLYLNSIYTIENMINVFFCYVNTSYFLKFCKECIGVDFSY